MAASVCTSIIGADRGDQFGSFRLAMGKDRYMIAFI
jgi:hypothetical protein